jgi:hypothetical protein
MFPNRPDDFKNNREVGTTVRGLRGANAYKHNFSRGNTRWQVRGERKASFAGVALHQLLKPWLVDGNLSLKESIDFAGILVYAHNRVATVCEAGSRNQAYISGSDNG